MAAMEPQVFVIEFERKNPENRFHGEDKTMAAGFNVPFLLHHAPKNASKHKNLQHQGTTWSSKEENAFGFLRDDMAFVLRAFMTHTKTPQPSSLCSVQSLPVSRVGVVTRLPMVSVQLVFYRYFSTFGSRKRMFHEMSLVGSKTVSHSAMQVFD